MTVGLGTGSTVAYLLPALAARGLELRCVATSPETMQAAVGLGLQVVPFTGLGAPVSLNLAIDGADQVAPSGWLVNISSNKLVDRLGPPVPLELEQFGLAATLRRLQPVRLRDVPPSPDGGVIADYTGHFEDPESLAVRLSTAPGVIEHGLFAGAMVDEILVGRGEEVDRMRPD